MTNHSDPFSTSTIDSELDDVTGACQPPAACGSQSIARKAPTPDPLDRRGWPFAQQQQQRTLGCGANPQQAQSQRSNFQQWWPQFQQFFRSFRNY